MDIAEYVMAHTERGECKCGRCIDVGNRPDPAGPHTVDLTIFKVAARNNPVRDTFVALAEKHKGEYAKVNPFDGKEHGFIELGAWIGDQGVALMFMGLGVSLGVFKLLSPETVMPFLDADMKMNMATQGYVTIQAKDRREWA